MTVNRLILGDNLEILKSMESDSIDLIYLDPPFFSNRNYGVIWGDTGEIRSFQDRWSGGISHYIDWLKERVIEMHRVLKPTGSIFLHCDWHANAYIRVHILDRIFLEKNFRNEIIWKRAETVKGNFGQGKKALDYNIDTIFYYAKTSKAKFNQPFAEYDEKTINRDYKHFDQDGRRYRLTPLDGPGGAAKGNPYYEFLGVSQYWRYSKEEMENRYSKGLIVQSKPGVVPMQKKYLDEGKGVPVQSLWDDISALGPTNKERIGYPTQKPETLLKRIIDMCSKEGDIVLDPFVGGGTTIAVADKLNRQWIGIDQSPMAIKVTELRLQKQTDLFTAPYTVQLYKYDYDTLRYKDAYEFESWIVQQFGGTGNVKQRGDFGLDGKMGDNTPIQVKRSDNIGRNVIDNFLSAVQRYDKNLFTKNVKAKNPVGYIIAFSFGKGAIEEVARLKNEDNTIVKLVKVDEIVPIAVKPVIGVHINELERDEKGNHEIEFVAVGQSPAGIEFYSWDFTFNKEKGFKPTVIIDKEGKQILTLKAGTHTIAVKVVDNDGLENTEVITLKINGIVEQVN
jgi:DNA modification methylase